MSRAPIADSAAKYPVAPMWRSAPADPARRLDRAIDAGAGRFAARGGGRPLVWFRADDIGVPSAGFSAMLDVFRKHRAPLALAVVPSWLTRTRWEGIRSEAFSGEGGLISWQSGQWRFHQHGRRHLNHEPEGRKCEFGPSRSREDKRRDLALGKARLESIMGRILYPAFTPAWNRFDAETGELLAELGYAAASRDDKAFLREPAFVPEAPVNCDLHTRRKAAGQAWEDMLAELEWNLGQGLLGVMLHHQRMNRAAVEFLDLLLGRLASDGRVECASLDEVAIR